MSAEVVGTIAALVTVAIVLRLVLKRRLLVKYATLWLVVSVVMVAIALVPGGLDTVSRLLHFELSSNLLFFAGFALLLFVTLQLSVELTKVEGQVQRLAEEFAIHEALAPHDPDGVP